VKTHTHTLLPTRRLFLGILFWGPDSRPPPQSNRKQKTTKQRSLEIKPRKMDPEGEQKISLLRLPSFPRSFKEENNQRFVVPK
jgi:hypothetical protein